MRAPGPPAIAALLASVTLAACGGGDGEAGRAASGPSSPSTPPPAVTPRADDLPPLPASTKGPAANASATRAIRGWADAARRGDSRRASTFFALPALVQNGDEPLLLRTSRDVRAFTEALPCGAVLLKAVVAPRGYTIGTFRLTDRPGSDCGAASGGYAATAFRFSGGRIKQWIRVDEDNRPAQSVTPPGSSPQPAPAPESGPVPPAQTPELGPEV